MPTDAAALVSRLMEPEKDHECSRVCSHCRERMRDAAAALSALAQERDHERHEKETVSEALTANIEWQRRNESRLAQRLATLEHQDGMMKASNAENFQKWQKAEAEVARLAQENERLQQRDYENVSVITQLREELAAVRQQSKAIAFNAAATERTLAATKAELREVRDALLRKVLAEGGANE